MTKRHFAVLVLSELGLAAAFAADTFVEAFALNLAAPSPVCLTLAAIVIVGFVLCAAIGIATPGVWS